MQIEFFGATREVTGSCYFLHVGQYRVLVECGLIQGSQKNERHNHDPFLFDPKSLDAHGAIQKHLPIPDPPFIKVALEHVQEFLGPSDSKSGNQNIAFAAAGTGNDLTHFLPGFVPVPVLTVAIGALHDDEVCVRHDFRVTQDGCPPMAQITAENNFTGVIPFM